MKKLLKGLEAFASFAESVSKVFSGISSMLPWIKKLISIVMRIFQSYHLTHRRFVGDVLFL
jgi:hypothetical protein